MFADSIIHIGVHVSRSLTAFFSLALCQSLLYSIYSCTDTYHHLHHPPIRATCVGRGRRIGSGVSRELIITLVRRCMPHSTIHHLTLLAKSEAAFMCVAQLLYLFHCHFYNCHPCVFSQLTPQRNNWYQPSSAVYSSNPLCAHPPIHVFRVHQSIVFSMSQHRCHSLNVTCLLVEEFVNPSNYARDHSFLWWNSFWDDTTATAFEVLFCVDTAAQQLIWTKQWSTTCSTNPLRANQDTHPFCTSHSSTATAFDFLCCDAMTMQHLISTKSCHVLHQSTLFESTNPLCSACPNTDVTHWTLQNLFTFPITHEITAS